MQNCDKWCPNAPLTKDYTKFRSQIVAHNLFPSRPQAHWFLSFNFNNKDYNVLGLTAIRFSLLDPPEECHCSSKAQLTLLFTDLLCHLSRWAAATHHDPRKEEIVTSPVDTWRTLKPKVVGRLQSCHQATSMATC